MSWSSKFNNITGIKKLMLFEHHFSNVIVDFYNVYGDYIVECYLITNMNMLSEFFDVEGEYMLITL